MRRFALHNQAPPDDTPEAITQRLDDLAREAERLIAAGAASDQATADQASDLGNTFGELEAKTEALRIAEKQPHIEAGRAVDGKWVPLRDRAEDLKKRIKAVVVTPWLTKRKDETTKAAADAIATGAAIDTVATPKVTAGSSKRSTGSVPFTVQRSKTGPR